MLPNYLNVFTFVLIGSVAIVAIGYLLYLSRKLVMWWTGINEVIVHQKETNRLLALIANKTNGPTSAPQSVLTSRQAL